MLTFVHYKGVRPRHAGVWQLQHCAADDVTSIPQPPHWLLLPLSSRKAPPLEFVIRRAGRQDVGAMAAMDGGGATWTADSIYVSGWGRGVPQPTV